MAQELMQPIVDQFVALLGAMGAAELGALPAFVKVRQGWTPVLVNAPEAAVLPIRTSFAQEGGAGAVEAVHQITVRLGITGADPEELTTRAVAYVRAVDGAINAWARAGHFPGYTLQVFVAEHDYGQMFVGNGKHAYWPDLYCQGTVEELA